MLRHIKFSQQTLPQRLLEKEGFVWNSVSAYSYLPDLTLVSFDCLVSIMLQIGLNWFSHLAEITHDMPEGQME
jgi:hypothetical protein